ncbi:MAG: hypothetical protein ABH800_01770 [Candidatus Nealsonbacteria bacterium]
MNRKLPFWFWIGISALVLFQILMIFEKETISFCFYVFVWWAYIIVLDGLVYKIKGSSIFSRLKFKISLLILASALFWGFFEALNLRINNWHYVATGDVHFPNALLKIVFALIAFGGVLPIIMETFEILKELGFWNNYKYSKKWSWLEQPAFLWIIIGFTMLILSLFWPDYFFWMIWITFIFILDPIIEKENGKSLLLELKKGRFQTFFLLLTAGLVCGFLWEFWNYWAGLKWVYTVPFVGEWKMFEMPIFGYFGFPCFALECYIFYQFLGILSSRIKRVLY